MRWLASSALAQRDLVSPREWVRLLGGVDLAPVPPLPAEPVDVAMFRFGDLPERVSLPPLDAHYISFTLRGALLIERDLGRAADRARFRPGMSLILPAERENTWRWDAATDELHLYIAPEWLGEMAGRVGRAAPEPVARFAFEDRLLRSLAQALLEERRSSGVGGTLFRQTLSEAIALHVLRTYCAPADAPFAARLAPAALAACARWWRSGADLSLDDLAGAARLSRAHFARAFRASTGQKPYAYLRARRVERARLLLAGTDLPRPRSPRPGMARRATSAAFSAHLRRHAGPVPRARCAGDPRERREAQPDVGRETVVAGALDVQRARLGHAVEALVQGRAVDPKLVCGRAGIARIVEEGLDRSCELRVRRRGRGHADRLGRGLRQQERGSAPETLLRDPRN